MLTSLAVAAALPEGVDVRIVDEEVQAVDFDTDTDLVGISFMTFNAPRAYQIADIFRLQKGKKVIMGGFHPSFMPQEAIQHADAVCIGEAEANLPDIIADFRAGKLQQFYQNGLADLSRMRPINRELIPRGKYVWADAVQATRGCRNRCTFCSITSFYGNSFRARPVEQVIQEFRSLGRTLIFMDDNITTDQEYAKELFSRMIPLKKIWFSQCSITIANNPELLSLAAKSGCRGLFIGLESLSQDNLHQWGKDFNRAADFRKSIRKLHSLGIAVFAAVVFGNDWDTPATFRQTLDFLLEVNADALQATILTPFPGTPLFDQMDKAGRITDRDWARYDFKNVVFAPANMDASTLQNGYEWVLNSFYGIESIRRRLIREAAYLPPWMIALASAPLNLGYRYRFRKNGIWKPDKLFNPC